MVMSEWDVVRYYNDLKSKAGATRLIAELNGASEREIIFILERHGINCKPLRHGNRKPKFDWSKVEELYHLGYEDDEIANETGFKITAVANWRTRHNLPSNYFLKRHGGTA